MIKMFVFFLCELIQSLRLLSLSLLFFVLQIDIHADKRTNNWGRQVQTDPYSIHTERIHTSMWVYDTVYYATHFYGSNER